MYVCEQLPGANSSPIVTKRPNLVIHTLGHSGQGQCRWGGMRSTERSSSYYCNGATWLRSCWKRR